MRKTVERDNLSGVKVISAPLALDHSVCENSVSPKRLFLLHRMLLLFANRVRLFLSLLLFRLQKQAVARTLWL